MKKRTGSKGFSVIEVLVVLAIITVLAAILFSVFSRVREQGRSSTCRSNLKQIALAVQLYIQDNNGSLPGWTNPNNLRDYIHVGSGQSNIYRCPTHPLRAASEEQSQQVDFTYNAGLVSHELYHLPIGGKEYVFSNASTTWLNTDVADDEKKYEQNVTPNIGHPCSFTTWHSDGANFSFLDGHVKWLTPEAACGIDNLQP